MKRRVDANQTANEALRASGTPESRFEANMRAGTSMDKWLREHPEATADEAGREFLRRYEEELGARE